MLPGITSRICIPPARSETWAAATRTTPNDEIYMNMKKKATGTTIAMADGGRRIHLPPVFARFDAVRNPIHHTLSYIT
jgi:hypothetical protein